VAESLPSTRAHLPASGLLAARHARIRQRLSALRLDALIVTCAPNIRYLSNHVGSAGVLVVTRDGLHLLVDFRYGEAVRLLQQSPGACPGLVVQDVPASYDEALLSCLEKLDALNVGFEAAHVPVATHARWRHMAETQHVDVTFALTEALVEEARAVKDSFEIATLREAAARLTSVAASAFDAVRAGETEQVVAGMIDAAIRDAGYERPAFDTIVASGPNAALPHHHPGDRVLADGDLVVLDFGGMLDGYCCDLTRMVSLGPPSSETRRLYDAVYDAHQTAIAAIRPGVESTAVDAAARSLLHERNVLNSRSDEAARLALKWLENKHTLGNVSFDALLIAEGGKRLEAIAALLPHFDLDPKKTRILGTGLWDVPGIGREPALLDAWFAAPPPSKRAKFIQQYKQIYGKEPARFGANDASAAT